MKNITLIIIVVVLMLSFGSNAQNIQGKAYYIVKSKVNTNFEGRQISEAQKTRIKKRQNELSTKNYVLEFDKNSSIFFEIENISQSIQQVNERNSGMRMLLNNQNEGTYYKHIALREYSSQRDLFGKQFLIKDTLQSFNWQLSDEVKIIGNYTCFKAISTIPIVDKIEKSKDSATTITAWYTIEIPVTHGPEMFWGLPGLILELKTENRALLCSKIELGSKETITITPPKKGKIVTQEMFDKIFAEKTKEIKEIYGNRKPGGGRGKI